MHRHSYSIKPGSTAARLGTFCSRRCIRDLGGLCQCLTGQASNILGASLVAKLGNVQVTWSSWFLAAIVPGALSCIAVPWIVYRTCPQSNGHLRLLRSHEPSSWPWVASVAKGTALAISRLWRSCGSRWLAPAGCHVCGDGRPGDAASQRNAGVETGGAGERRVGGVHLVRRAAAHGQLLNNTGATKVFANKWGRN